MDKKFQETLEIVPFKSKRRKFINPFPGLRPFGVNESHLFFGREGQSDDVLVKLANHKFVAVIGPSGSGKSSFMYCGVVPKLYGGFMAVQGSEWKVIVTRVGVDPTENLANSLLEIDESYQNATSEDKRIRKIITTTLLQTQSSGLVECIAQYQNQPENCNYLIIVDQFEELFRFKQLDPAGGTIDKALAFVNLLTEAVSDIDSNIFVALAMRSDFIGDCAQYSELTRMINESNYLIPQMTREQKRMAILGPVAVGGSTISPKLVQRLLNELGDNPDQLPVLAHALMRTWDYWESHKESEEEPIDISHYESIGRMEEALSQHADEAYNELSEFQKEVCESLFKSLVGRGANKTGIRRPTRLDEISQIASASHEDVIIVVDKFRQPGRALLTPPHSTALDGDSVIDFSHESLMRIWGRLKNWVEEENESIQMYLRLAEAAEMYQVGKAGLWRPPDLQLALNWYLKEKPTLIWAQRYHPAFERTIAFLEHSSEKYETEQQVKEMLAKRALRRSQVTAVVLGAAMVVSLMFLVYAIFQRIEAEYQASLTLKEKIKSDQNAELAAKNERKAIKSAKEADTQRILAEKRQLEAEEARNIADKARIEALRQKGIAETQTIFANKKEKEARYQEQEAIKSKNEAINQTKIAVTEKEKADRLRMLSISRSMAVKSLKITDDPEKKAALAQHSFIFNDKYNGTPDDPDVYDGLYEAIRDLSGGKVFNQLQGHDDAVSALAPVVKGNLVYSSGQDGRIYRWDADNFKQPPVLISRNNFINRGLAVSRDNKYLANAGEVPYIQLFDLTSNTTKPKNINVSTSEVWFLSFTNDNKGLVYGDSTSIQYTDFTQTREIVKFAVKNLCMSLNPANGSLAVGNKNGQVILINPETKQQTTLYENNVPIRSIVFSNSGKMLAAGDYNGIVRIWDVSTQKMIHILSGHRALVDNIRFNNDDSQMASASFDKKVLIWNTDRFDQQQPIVLNDHGDWMFSVAFTPDGKSLMTGGRYSELRYWPTHVIFMSDILCSKLNRNLSQREWEQFVSKDIKYEKTCPNLPDGN